MKKTLCTLLLGTTLLTTVAPVFAENFTYKVYNPRTNKAYTAILGTISITDYQYLWAFYTTNGSPLCVAQIYNTNTKNGLVGGQCTDANTFIRFINGDKRIDPSKYEMGWRELSKNTLYPEMNSIRRERASQGKYEYTGSN